VKRRATHNQYFPEYANLVNAVDDALAYFASQAAEIKSLMGLYVSAQAELVTVA
jgi:hypothetical protein